jgi:thiol-disulfide isomerase/thioredoxin
MVLARRSAVLLAGLLLAGCTAQPAGQDRPPVPNEVSLRIVDEAGLAEVLRQHRGQPVLLDIWATWCPACLDLFPETVALSRRFADRGLVTVSLSLDDPDQEAEVREFLESQQPAFENFISRYGGSTRSAKAFEIDGTLPAIRVYDRSGKVHANLKGEITPEAVRRAVEEVL